MTQLNLLELARQGDADAIASLINRQLQPKGINAKVSFQEACLVVVLESDQVPNQKSLITFVRKGIINLDTSYIQRLIICGQKTGDDIPAWSQDFYLDIIDEESNGQFTVNPHTLTVSINLSGDNASKLTTQTLENLANKMSQDIFSSFSSTQIRKVSISNGKSVITKER